MNPLKTLVRLRAVVGLGLVQLRRSPGRALLAVAAVAVAALAVTLLASLGVGVVEIGQEGFEEAGRDVWITADPLDPSPGGAENPIVDSHAIALEVTAREDVQFATPVATHSAYVGTDPDELEPVAAVGVRETHEGFDFLEGEGFSTDPRHYESDGSAAEVVVDPRIAEAHDLAVGDTLVLGTSRESAPRHEFVVVGISTHHSEFLGQPAVTVPTAELQRVAGTRGTDRATFVVVTVDDDADATAVREELAESYPNYDVRTSDDQLLALIEQRAPIVAGGVTLVGLAVVGGLVLTVNLFVLVAYAQRRELAALRAIGLSRWLLAGTVAVQGLLIGLVGGLVALLATPRVAAGLNRLVAGLVGFEEVLRTPVEVYVVAVAIAVGVGTVTALAAGWRAGRHASVDRLDA